MNDETITPRIHREGFDDAQFVYFCDFGAISHAITPALRKGRGYIIWREDRLYYTAPKGTALVTAVIIEPDGIRYRALAVKLDDAEAAGTRAFLPHDDVEALIDSPLKFGCVVAASVTIKHPVDWNDREAGCYRRFKHKRDTGNAAPLSFAVEVMA